MLATHSTIDIPALKARHSLGDVVEAAGIRLRGQGRVRQGLCPFHREAEGSFTVYSDSERWYCFGCGEGGDVLDFVQRTENLSLPEALRRLDGSPIHASQTTGRPKTPPRPAPPAVPPRNPRLLTAAARFYSAKLRASPEALNYLSSRGIDPSAAAGLGLGFSTGRGLKQALEVRGFSSEQIEDSGLLMRSRERFGGMIVVPQVSGGLCHWLAGRATRGDAKPRFQSLPGPKPVLGRERLETPLTWSVVAEGLFDWLTLVGWGVPAVAALGTQGLERIASALRGCPRVFVAFDNDQPGGEAAAQLSEMLGRRAVVVSLPPGTADVGDLANRPHGRILFHSLLTRAARSAR